MADGRYTRQVRLAEVGEGGQERLAHGEAHVRGVGIAARIEARYLAGAGLGAVSVEHAAVREQALALNPSVVVSVVPTREASAAPAPEWLAPLDPSAREVALGALRALDVIRAAVLGGTGDARQA